MIIHYFFELLFDLQKKKKKIEAFLLCNIVELIIINVFQSLSLSLFFWMINLLLLKKKWISYDWLNVFVCCFSRCCSSTNVHLIDFFSFLERERETLNTVQQHHIYFIKFNLKKRSRRRRRRLINLKLMNIYIWFKKT